VIRNQPDDWGKALGEDPEIPAKDTRPKKALRKDTTAGLVNYFSSLLPTDAWGKLNSPVNVKAMMAGVSKMKKAGHSPDDIRSMMDLYSVEITRKPLPEGVAAWRGFLANLDSLAAKAFATNTKEPDSYDDLQPDTIQTHKA
jgi:hypothetical protein